MEYNVYIDRKSRESERLPNRQVFCSGVVLRIWQASGIHVMRILHTQALCFLIHHAGKKRF